MALTAAEQYLLELINRTRLDPVAEAARHGIDLNAGLAAGTLIGGSRQVLAPNALLETAAIGHSQWMLGADVFSHTGANGSTPASRAAGAGYFASNLGENLAWRGASGTMNLEAIIATQHQDLFLSAGHRENLLQGAYREVGIAQEAGRFGSWNASMLTELFGKTGTSVMLTGVVYNDANKDGFYSIGEGQSNMSISGQGHGVSAQAAGGYSLALSAGAAISVSGSIGATAFSAVVAMPTGNVKLDVVNGTTFLCSGTITLGSGINTVRLLGLDAVNAVGNAADNLLIGNSGSNKLLGSFGNDTVRAGGGNDTVNGDAGNDVLFGEFGSDRLYGIAGNDRLDGGAGADQLSGGIGDDILTGGTQADAFVFCLGYGKDIISDFASSEGDRLQIDDALWGQAALSTTQVVQQFAHLTAAGVVFEFDAATSLTLTGLNTLAGLANAISII